MTATFVPDGLRNLAVSLGVDVTGMTEGQVTSAVAAMVAERLKAVDAAKYASQADFVRLIADRTGYYKLEIRKNPLNSNLLDVILYSVDGVRHITWSFGKDPHDDFVLLDAGYEATTALTLTEKQNLASRTGTWVTSNANNYTSVIGSTMTGVITGEEIRFVSYTDNRGGIWSFTVDGGAPVEISTWSSVAASYVIQTLFTGLANTAHTVVGTFMGADPLHAPTGGTARGWAWYTADAPPYPAHATFESYSNYFPVQSSASGKVLIAPTSNKEGAFAIRAGSANQWFPEHSGVGTAFAAEPAQYLLDGALVDFSSMVAGERTEGKVFELRQHVYCQFVGVEGNIAELYITHRIGLDGVVSISADVTWLQDCEVISGYGLMLPTKNAVLNEFVSGIGTSLVNPADESTVYWPDEQDRVYSYAVVGAANPDYIAAMTIDYPYESLRIGQEGRADLEEYLMIWGRADTCKAYQRVFVNALVSAGERYRYHGSYAIGRVPNIYRHIRG